MIEEDLKPKVVFVTNDKRGMITYSNGLFNNAFNVYKRANDEQMERVDGENGEIILYGSLESAKKRLSKALGVDII